MKKIIVSMLVIMGLTSAVVAAPTLSGQTGGLLVADAYATKSIEIGVYQFADEPSDYPLMSVAVPVMDALELSASLNIPDAKDKTCFMINGKYELPIDVKAVKLAVGASYMDYQADGWAVSAIGTKEIYGVELSANISYGEFDKDSYTDLVIGAEKRMANNMVLGAEFMTANKIGAKSGANLYLRYSLNINFEVLGGLNDIGNNASNIIIGGVYSF